MEIASHIQIACPHSTGGKAEMWVLRVGVAVNTEGLEIFPRLCTLARSGQS